ncbi:MAG TPA: PASTA domain-containing protein [bacterium]|nr:PASTA domain-containing protein [bacterium]
MKQPRKHRSHKLRGLLIFVLVLAALVAALNWFLMPLFVRRGRETTVPSVIGMDRFAATESLLKAGLVIGEVRSVSNATVPPDRIVAQHPEPGQRVKTGRQVQLDISHGGARMKVPHVEGLTLARASALLTESGLVLAGVESLRSPTLPQGQVVSTRPAAGEDVEEGDRVSVQVASRTGSFPMPTLVGMSLASAQGVITSQGLSLGEVKRAPSDEPAGNVLVQYPEEGMTVRDLDTVNLIVAAPAGRR